MSSLPRRTLLLVAWLWPLLPGAASPPIVAGFERFGTAAEADLRTAGELLLGELNCTACHEADTKTARRLTPHAGPKLGEVGSRLRPDFLGRWLAEPHRIKPGTTMPDVLAALSADQKPKVIAALTHYLVSLRGPQTQAEPAPGSVERGRHLYHQIGCVACHAPDPDFLPPTAPGVTVPKIELPSVPHSPLGEKYTAPALQRFLLDPLAVRPSARMPQVPMSVEEAGDLAAYLTRQAPPARPWTIDPQLAAEGARQFVSLGCAACHDVPDVAFKSPAPSLAALARNGAEGCLSTQPPARLPNYNLSERQRAALLIALQPLEPAAVPTPAQAAQRLMTALNCFACHTRHQQGGPEPGRAVYFDVVGDVDLGDEGRLPPGLTGVGAKLQTAAIERTVLGAGAVRPYMATRMPNFGADHAAALAELFTAADYHPRKEPIPNIGRNTVGRELVGLQGVACIACHGVKGRKSLGVPAVDLMSTPQRLRREWFHAYLIDPGALRPGTRMPSFWPGGLPANPKWGKDRKRTEHQIDSIWVYLTELDQSRLPEGLEEKGEFELKPADKPIVFRTFMEGVGMQAVAVGFPQKIHAAFDAKSVRWALAWRGAFLDAEGTWEERAAPLAKPLSEDVSSFPAGPMIAALANPEAPWPTSHEAQFQGYRLDAQGVPTFLYRIGSMDVADRIEAAADGKTLRRTLTAAGVREGAWLRAAAGPKITPAGEGAWQAEGGQTIQALDRSIPAQVRSRDGQQELLVPLRPDAAGQVTLTFELTW